MVDRLLPLLVGRAVVEGAATVFASFPVAPEVPESLQNPPILPNISLANDESPPPPVLEPTSVVVPSPLPPVRKELIVESLRRESPSREVVVLDTGGLLAVEVGGLLLCPERCPATTEVDCPNDDCPEVEPTEFGCAELLVEELCPGESRGGVLVLVEAL